MTFSLLYSLYIYLLKHSSYPGLLEKMPELAMIGVLRAAPLTSLHVYTLQSADAQQRMYFPETWLWSNQTIGYMQFWSTFILSSLHHCLVLMGLFLSQFVYV